MLQIYWLKVVKFIIVVLMVNCDIGSECDPLDLLTGSIHMVTPPIHIY